ncbi:MAG: ATPase, T2SS/T4P/T4SS family [Patescibacteria group bacterium]|nr:ATPase, T2SS/T4P/T4SS family [Patescibacteria group bacterium]
MEVPSIFLNRILAEAAKRRASSLHFSVGSQPIARIDDKLIPLEKESILTSELLNKIIGSFVGEDEAKRLQEEREIVVVKNFAGDFRFRVNIFYQKDLPTISFNYIPAVTRSLEDLKLPAAFKEKINLNSGLLIVAGPNGSGKTSTVAAFIEDLNQREKKYVITLEDPIEYLFLNKKSVIEQRQIGRDVKSYTAGLKHCLDEDVDLVYVDEMKKEFAAAIPLVLQLAAGNSLVLLEMNAVNSIRVIEKILDAARTTISPEAARFSLADVLVGIVTQKLIPRLGGGLALASEVLIINPAIKSLIREGKIYQTESIIQTSREEGMISMEKSIDDLLKKGEVSQEEAKKIKPNI